MVDDYGVSSLGGGTPNPFGNVNHDHNTSEKNNYIVRPPTFSGDSIEFEWWKSKIYTYIISLDDDLWDILEDGIDIQVNEVGMVSGRKSLTPAQKKIYKKLLIVRGVLVDVLPHYEYIIIIDKSTAQTIFKSISATYEGNEQN